MYKNLKVDNQTSLSFESINSYFGNRLDPKNRWIALCRIIPWDELEQLYAKQFASQKGAPALSFRIALGALIIKEKLNLTDRETLAQILENPYLQIFIGISDFAKSAPFHHSMMTHFRKAISKEMLSEINDIIVKKQLAPAPPEPKTDSSSDDETKPPTPKGKLLIDATCTPADIRYPTDLNLLNDSREKLEEIIDVLWDLQPEKQNKPKPRTYRKVARKAYLVVATKPKSGAKKIRKAIKKQLGYVRRNLKIIDDLKQFTSLQVLNKDLYRKLLVASEIYRQQEFMYMEKTHSTQNRIVSLSQPHVRPIPRGKAGKPTEFGAKIGISNVEGYVFMDCFNWESYNEGSDLIEQAEQYKDRYGHYPELICADKIYRTQSNRKWCKKNDIRLSGPPLGRPPKQDHLSEDEKKLLKKQRYMDEVTRIPVEGSIGVSKRRYTLDNVMTKLSQTSECAIGLVFIVMNMEKILRDLFCTNFWAIGQRLWQSISRICSLIQLKWRSFWIISLG